MTKVVLDSSALMAYINKEPGSQRVAALLPGALICSVNVCEVMTKMVAAGWPPQNARHWLSKTSVNIVDFDLDLAVEAGGIVTLTRSRGLSLGDRACLALAAREGLPALTSDRAWKDADVGAAIEFVR